MDYTSRKYDSAFEALLEAREETNSNDVAIAEHEKEIRKLKNKKADDERQEHVLAANYFTPDKIRELHDDTIRLLKCDDFDQNYYVEIFSNSTKIKREHIDFLISRQEELKKTEEKISNCKHDAKDKTSGDFWLSLAEVFMGGKANDD